MFLIYGGETKTLLADKRKCFDTSFCISIEHYRRHTADSYRLQGSVLWGQINCMPHSQRCITQLIV
jgi:hypothetical protein